MVGCHSGNEPHRKPRTEVVVHRGPHRQSQRQLVVIDAQGLRHHAGGKAVAKLAVRRADQGVHTEAIARVHEDPYVRPEQKEVLGHGRTWRNAIAVRRHHQVAIFPARIGFDAPAHAHPHGRVALPAEQVDSFHAAARTGIEVGVLRAGIEVPALRVLRVSSSGAVAVICACRGACAMNPAPNKASAPRRNITAFTRSGTSKSRDGKLQDYHPGRLFPYPPQRTRRAQRLYRGES